MTKYEALALFGIMNMHPDNFFLGINTNISDLSWGEKDDILIYLSKLNIPFEQLFDLFDEQYDYFYYDKDKYCYSIDYFILEADGRIGVVSKLTMTIGWLDEYGKWRLEEKSECGNSAIDF